VDSRNCRRAGNAARNRSIGDLGEALGQAYVEKYFSPEAKQEALKMVKEIQTGDGPGHKKFGLDVACDQATGAGQAARHGQ